ncbi:hypothetical protein HU200_066931 [Digitaria exilis]|uniref:WRKY19-like zinc finger domain-containing protein n=1 Tax=Digitaria exilis TaxID=1010633 RepID=A0A835DTE2_9POAL|nr:hypothetical protein HU200_066931 [Digitaria exilis]
MEAWCFLFLIRLTNWQYLLRAKAFPVSFKSGFKSSVQTLQHQQCPTAEKSSSLFFRVVHSQQRSCNTKVCSYPECLKGARGSSGLCIAHGGGRRCQRKAATKGQRVETISAKPMEVGGRCDYLWMAPRALKGRTDFCIAHGGGRRCSQEGCKRAARGEIWTLYQAWWREEMQKPNCTKSARRTVRHVHCSRRRGADVSILIVARELRAALTSAKPWRWQEMHTPRLFQGSRGKYTILQGPWRWQTLFSLKVAPRACMVGHTVLCRTWRWKACVVEDAGRVQEAALTAVLVMAGASDASLLAVGRVRRAVLPSAKHTVEADAACGGIPGSDLGSGVAPCDRLARGKRACVISTILW